MKTLTRKTADTEKHENVNFNILNKDEGITLIALVVTIIIQYIQKMEITNEKKWI